MMVVVPMVMIMVMMEMANDAGSCSDGSPNSSSGPWRRLAFLFYLIYLFLWWQGIGHSVSRMLYEHFISQAWRIWSHACYTNTLYPRHGGWEGKKEARGVNACTHTCVHTC